MKVNQNQSEPILLLPACPWDISNENHHYRTKTVSILVAYHKWVVWRTSLLRCCTSEYLIITGLGEQGKNR